MADLKISELTNLTAADPANDMIPIVDVSATPPASGSTKRISINNILACSPTATLASATITGAATVGTTLGVTGVATFAAGTALLPALTTTGDTNTGIYYPAADTFAVTAGGSERFRIDTSGNVGIGVVPSYRLDVLGPTTISGRFKTSGALNALYLEDSGTTAGTLYIGTSGNEFRIVTGSNVALAVDVNRNFAIGPTSVTTTATDGFVYIPVCAGAPTGTPTAKGGRAAFVVDSTNNRFYVYVGGAWKYAALV